MILILFNANLIIGTAAPASSPPNSYHIAGVLQHKQMNALLCGPAALEIVFDFWGEDIDQKVIANVARTSSKGTYAWDIARSGHFSYLSTARGSYFSHDIPAAGFPQRQIGYATFNYSSDNFWWEDLKSLIASNIPVVLLMKYAPFDDTGHYRVIVGYDEPEGVVYFMDPWDRDLKRVTNPDGTVTWTMDDFKKAWNYSKYGTTYPYWGAIIMPWSIDLVTEGKTTKGSTLNVTAKITYTCPQPFDCSTYPASNVSAEIILPQGMFLQKGSSQINIGDLKAGGSASVTWNVKLDSNGKGSSITVKAGGLVSGAVPDVMWPGIFYPGYGYEDHIGGDASIKI
ncbi:MAG: C39 family peptidase [Candidatus Methanoperedens sp.]|nr:C39 family peptidase [Candidatus Methanoperedens sp.]